ncbi:MAG: xylose isomerase [Pirellulaceae bacterium]|nr:MAG: xylose isomerase [Pirellulaceae bacterium]
MAQISVNELTTYRWSFDEDVRNYLEAGIQAMGVWREKLADFGEERGIEMLRDHQVRVSSLLWAGGFTGSDGRSYKESVNDARHAIRLAGALGARCLVVYSGGRGIHTHNHARRLLRSALTDLLPLADEFGVDLAIEPMHAGCAGNWTFLTSLDDTLAFIQSLDSPRVKLTFDSYHLAHDPRILERIAEIVPWTAIVQVGDGRTPPNGEQNRCPLGDGCLPLKELVRAFVANGYDGFFDVELLGEDVEAADYRDLLRKSRAFLESALSS